MYRGRTRTVVALGSAQTLAWGSTYYLPAVLATPMAADLGVPAPVVFAAFSVALVVSALIGPSAGRLIDRRGGRGLLVATNGLFALGLVALGSADGPLALFAAWALIGVAMGAGLYEAAFATLVQLYRHESRDCITGVTLIAGFASTIAWPTSSLLEAEFGWRGACYTWGALHLVLGLPLNLLLPRAVALAAAAVTPAGVATAAVEAPPPTRHPLRTSVLLGYVFAVTYFIATAMAAHLPRLLEASGASVAVAIGVGALVGPAQVAGRLIEFGFLRHVSPLVSARLAALAHPLGVFALLFGGPFAAALFALLHGAGNGILTIAKGTLPLVLFGADGYGARQGWLALPARIAMAGAPVVFGIALDGLGAAAAWLSGGLAFSAFLALLALHVERPPVAVARVTAS